MDHRSAPACCPYRPSRGYGSCGFDEISSRYLRRERRRARRTGGRLGEWFWSGESRGTCFSSVPRYSRSLYWNQRNVQIMKSVYAYLFISFLIFFFQNMLSQFFNRERKKPWIMSRRGTLIDASVFWKNNKKRNKSNKISVNSSIIRLVSSSRNLFIRALNFEINCSEQN